MNHVMMTHTTTHRGVTSTKLCTMIEGKKFCEVEEGNARDAGQIMLGLFGGIITWAVLSFITYKIITGWFKLDEFDDGAILAGMFSLFAPLGYLGLFLVVFG
mgnify:CR=1 FL=1